MLAQPKRLALLLYLALARPHGPQRRDSLLALFWPEGDTEHARAALRQALHFLRHSLGEAVLCTQGDEAVGVGDGVACDVWAFEAALAAGELERALGLYPGDLLPGFFVEGAPAFERWLDGERTRLRERALQACTTLADARQEAADTAGAAGWLRQALALAPDDDALLLRLMRLLARSGDRSGALAAFENHARQLWADLEIQPSAAARALAAELRRPTAMASAPPAVVPPSIQPQPGAAVDRDAVHATPGGPRRIRRAALVALVLIAALTAVVAYAISQRRAAAARSQLDPNLIMVLPFRVAGANPDLAYLREGMVDLLAVRLGGDTAGPRVLDPRALMGALQRWGVSHASDLPSDSARGLARRLNAGRVVLGEVVSVPGRLVLSASVRRVRTGEPLPPISVHGPPDSLLALVDRLAAGILSTEATAEPDRTAYLTTASLPALRAYLEGQAVYRQGHPREAAARFRSAVDLDSTFALATLGLYRAASWNIDPIELEPTLALAWRWRSHLLPDERALLQASVGPRYPAPSPVLERLAAWQAAAQRFPKRPDAWVELGEIILHWGTFVDLPGVLPQARTAFDHALALDSTLMLALYHLVDLATLQGDTAALRRYEALLLAGRPESDFRLVPLVARAHLHLPGAASALHAFGDTAAAEATSGLLVWAAIGYIDPVIADAAVRRLAAAPVERHRYLTSLHDYALNRGRPSEALKWVDSLAATRGDRHYGDRMRLNDALFWDGSMAAAAAVAARLEAAAPERLSPEDLYYLELWRLRHHERAGAEAAIRRIALGPETARSAGSALRARILTVLLAAERRSADLPARVAELDSALTAGVVLPMPPQTLTTILQGNLILVGLRFSSGNAPGALRAANRCPLLYGTTMYAATFRRLQAEAALAAGDPRRAARAATVYLRLRSNPEPELRGEVEAFRRQFQPRESASAAKAAPR